jgi:hypothetical protein
MSVFLPNSVFTVFTFHDVDFEDAADVDAEVVEEDDVQPFSYYPYEEYEESWKQYMGELALCHKEHMQYYLLGLLSTQNLMPETTEDVCISNIYALSWFYNGPYPFDSYEAERDSYFHEQGYLKMIENDVDDDLSM